MNTFKLIGLLCILTGLAILGFHLFSYLKNGEWIEYTLLDVALRRGPIVFVNWLKYPTCWYGAHKIIHFALESISTFAFVSVAGFYILSAGKKDEEETNNDS